MDLGMGGFLFKWYQWEVFKVGKKMMKSFSLLWWIEDEEQEEPKEGNPRVVVALFHNE